MDRRKGRCSGVGRGEGRGKGRRKSIVAERTGQRCGLLDVDVDAGAGDSTHGGTFQKR